MPFRACWRRWGFPPQKPERRAAERDEAAIARWIERDWPRIKRRARRRRAHLVFIDETGFLLAPLVCRTWGLRGRTPQMRQRTRHHRRVSAIGALAISPQRRRLGWYLHFHLDRSISQDQVLDFLRDLLRHLAGPLIVVWDRLASHRSRLLRRWLRRCRRLHLEYLPPYAPELNPNEYGWAHLKTNSVANYCPPDVQRLHARVACGSRDVASRQPLLRSFVRHTHLPIRFDL
jgi:transposase